MWWLCLRFSLAIVVRNFCLQEPRRVSRPRATKLVCFETTRRHRVLESIKTPPECGNLAASLYIVINMSLLTLRVVRIVHCEHKHLQTIQASGSSGEYYLATLLHVLDPNDVLRKILILKTHPIIIIINIIIITCTLFYLVQPLTGLIRHRIYQPIVE